VGRRLGLAVLVLLVVPVVALASVGVNITTAGEEFYEDGALTVAVFDGTAGTTRLVATFGPAAEVCAAEPAADPRPVVVDAPADGVASGSAVPADPGTYRACGWALDASGAVRSRSEQVQEVVSRPAEVTAGAAASRVWPGIPLFVSADAYAFPGRLLQVAVALGTCPAAAPAEDDPAVVDWVSAPAGDVINRASARSASGQVSLAVPGRYAVCSWVGETPGDPAPEAKASAPLTIVAGRARTALALTADRSLSDGTKPVRWSVTVIGAFRGRLVLEARKVVHTPSGALRGSGPWKRVAAADLARQRVRSGRQSGLAGPSYLRVTGKTVLPAAIGRECGTRARVAQVRARFSGSPLARPARSKVVELPGSLGGC
jgi:hypothetical protein